LGGEELGLNPLGVIDVFPRGVTFTLPPGVPLDAVRDSGGTTLLLAMPRFVLCGSVGRGERAGSIVRFSATPTHGCFSGGLGHRISSAAAAASSALSALKADARLGFGCTWCAETTAFSGGAGGAGGGGGCCAGRGSSLQLARLCFSALAAAVDAACRGSPSRVSVLISAISSRCRCRIAFWATSRRS
jgi:hypothetical protein